MTTNTHFLPLTVGGRYVLVTDLIEGWTYSAAEQHGWLLSLTAGEAGATPQALVYSPGNTPAPTTVHPAQIIRRYTTWDRAISAANSLSWLEFDLAAARTEQEPESA